MAFTPRTDYQLCNAREVLLSDVTKQALMQSAVRELRSLSGIELFMLPPCAWFHGLYFGRVNS